MFKSLRIRNYRVFKDLEISGLHRINLIAGKNNSGKTSLLEAIFLLAQGSNPVSALSAGIFRSPHQSDPTDARRTALHIGTFYRQIFHVADTDQTIVLEGTVHIDGRDTPSGKMSLSIYVDQPEVTELIFGSNGENGELEIGRGRSLVFVPKYGNLTGKERRLQMTGRGVRVHGEADVNVSLKARVLFSGLGNTRDDAIDLALLRTKRQGDIIYKALSAVEPRLKALEDSSASGEPMIWADVEGMPELMPLPVMGEGMTRLTRMLLAIANAPGGVVLIDEIENGFHHSVQTKVWKSIACAAEQFDTQIFATTHSYECFENAVNALGSDGFRFIRPRKTRDGGNEAVVYEPEMIEAAIRHYIEVR